MMPVGLRQNKVWPLTNEVFEGAKNGLSRREGPFFAPSSPSFHSGEAAKKSIIW